MSRPTHLYNLSANPGSTFNDNYIYDNAFNGNWYNGGATQVATGSPPTTP